MNFTEQVRIAFGVAFHFLLLSPGSALGAPQQEPSLEETLFFSDIPTIVTATRLSQSVASAPVAATVIDREMIDASGFTEVSDLMRLVPGFHVAHAEGNLFVVTYHGQGSEYPSRLQILVNGRSVYTSLLSTVNWDHLGVTIEDIEKIEVMRGPNVPSYGSNAFNGAINIITRDPNVDYSSASTLVGSEDNLLHVARFAKRFDDAAFRLTVFSRKHDGFDGRNDHRDIKSFNFRAALLPKESDEFGIEFGASDGESGALGGTIETSTGAVIENPYSPVREKQTTSNFQNIWWRHSFNKSHDLNVRVFRNVYEQEDAFTLGYSLSELLAGAGQSIEDFTAQTGEVDQEIPFGVLSGDAERLDLDIQHTWVSDSQIRLSWGGGYGKDILRDSDLAFSDEDIVNESGRVFANGIFPLGSANDLNLGLIYERSGISEGIFSPRIALNSRLNDRHSLRFSYAEACRFPSLMEVNINGAIRLSSGYVLDELHKASEDLGAEHIKAYDIGYMGRLFNSPLNWELKLFYEEIENVITSQVQLNNDLDGRVRYWLNDGDIETTGFEGQIAYRTSNLDFVTLQFSHAKSIANYHNGSSDDLAYTTKLGMPRNALGVLGSKSLFSNWHVGFGLYQVGRMEWLRTGDIVDSYTRLDGNITRSFKLPKSITGKLTIGVQNIDNEYQEFKQDVTVEPRYYLKVSFRE